MVLKTLKTSKGGQKYMEDPVFINISFQNPLNEKASFNSSWLRFALMYIPTRPVTNKNESDF